VDPLILAGALSIAAGVAFFATVTYLFTVLRQAGLDLAMFDDPARLLLWVSDHSGRYQGMWLLYFVSQALLLCVPWLIAEDRGARAAAVFGTASVVVAMVGLAVQYAASPVTAAAYQAALAEDGSGSASVVLAMHTVVADVGKDLRLFSEVLLGVWLVLVGARFAIRAGSRAWWLLAALGCWTVMVVGWKLVDPTMPHEDWLAFLLGVGYIGFGVGLVRLARRPALLT
jgi:hypothetical protein